MNFLMKIYFALILIILTNQGIAQNQKDTSSYLIQFSGVVVAEDSLQALPFVHIYDNTSKRGTVSDYFGFFSFVAKEGDTLVFSNLGFKDTEFIIPDSLSEQRYSMIQMMKKDTITLKEVKIYPWPSKEEFANAFINMDAPMDDIRRAQSSLSKAERERLAHNMQMDARMNYNWQTQQQRYQLYYNGQAPPISIFNPVAWSKFIRAWKNGDLKR